MQIFVTDPVQQTLLFMLGLGIILAFTYVRKKNYTPLALTQELKGLAILAVIFAHIGYSLSADDQFLFPLSILAGVGVNLFLFLSGYGLTFSNLRKKTSIFQFYKKRLSKLFIPFWVVLGILFVVDLVILNIAYPDWYYLQSFAGIFMSADMATDVNSPLWYFSLILLYYVLFPLVFSRRYTWLTAVLLYGAVWSIVALDPEDLSGVIGLYEVHMLAFPLGVLVAWFVCTQKRILISCRKVYTHHARYTFPIAVSALCILIGYLAINSNVGEEAVIEEFTSLFLMGAIIVLFMIKKGESKLLSLFGFFSYEIYLFHWPLLYRYDVLYTHLPAWLATLLYLGVFIGGAWVLKNILELPKRIVSK